MDQNNNSGYGKRPLWQWVVIYGVVGLIVYGLVYYFVLAKRGGYTNPSSTTPTATVTPTISPETTPPATQTSDETVILTETGFSPAKLTIKAGTKVTWSNRSGNGATVNSDPHPIHTGYQPLNLGSFQNGETLSLTFDKPGTYGYHNHLNPSQKGTIVVE